MFFGFSIFWHTKRFWFKRQIRGLDSRVMRVSQERLISVRGRKESWLLESARYSSRASLSNISGKLLNWLLERESIFSRESLLNVRGRDESWLASRIKDFS